MTFGWMISIITRMVFSSLPASVPLWAAALGIATGAPCLVIDRYTWRSARTLTAVRLLYPGDTHRLVARFGGS